MSLAALLTVSLIALALVLLWTDRVPADHALLGAVVVLMVFGVITPAEAFVGFSSPGMLTVAALFVVGAGLNETGVIRLMTDRVFGRAKGERAALLRLVPLVILASAFLNNTLIVAALLPAVREWGRRNDVPPGRLLLPLSYAALLGGCTTLIGTSTNLVVAGLVEELIADMPGLRPVAMFDITPLGIGVALAGGTVLVLLAPLLLPARRPAVSPADDPREYTAELMVQDGSRLVGRTIEEAGLRHLPGVFLMEIVRPEGVVAAVGGEEVLRAGDRLVFVGDVQAVVELPRQPGLVSAPDAVFRLGGDGRRIVEAVVSARNPLAGRSIRDAAFRNRYRAVVIAVARGGQRLQGRIGDIVLHPGDVLLLEAHPDFIEEHRARSEFTLLSPVEGGALPRWDRAGRALAVLVALVLAFALAPIPPVASAFLAAGAMVVLRCCSVDAARRALDLPVLVAIAAAFGLGEAMRATGVDDLVVGLAAGLGVETAVGGLAVTWLLTVLCTEVLTNNAAAVLCLPIGLAFAQRFGVDPMRFVFTVMIAASSSYLTPIGYQTNLMVFGPGGYRATDYLRLGLPMTVSAAAVTLLLAPRLIG